MLAMSVYEMWASVSKCSPSFHLCNVLLKPSFKLKAHTAEKTGNSNSVSILGIENKQKMRTDHVQIITHFRGCHADYSYAAVSPVLIKQI